MSSPPPASLRALWPALLAPLLVVPAALIAAIERFDGLYGQDPFAYFTYSTGPFREALLRLTAPPPFFWPPGYPLPVALASLIVGPVPLAGQLVSLIAGGSVPVFTALLAREVWAPAREESGEGSPLVMPLAAGLAAAFTGQLWQSSVVVMADTTGLALATAGVWALARYGRTGMGRWLVLAAVLLAWATAARWIYGIVAIPCALYALVVLGRRDPRTALLHGGGAALGTLLVLGPILLPALPRLLARSGEITPFAGNFHVYGWNPARAFGREFVTVDGLLTHDVPNGLYYALAPARWAYFTPLIAPLVVLGAWTAVRRRTAALVLLIGGWWAVVFAFHAGAPYQNFRFTLAYLPPLAILAGIGLERLQRLGGSRFARPIGVYFALGLTMMMIAGAHTTRTLIARKNDDVATVQWAAARMPAETRLFTFELTHTFRRYTSVETLDLFDLDLARMRALLATDRPTYVLADTAKLARQWPHEPPGRNFQWLHDGPGLRDLGERGGYTLFRANSGGNGWRSESW